MFLQRTHKQATSWHGGSIARLTVLVALAVATSPARGDAEEPVAERFREGFTEQRDRHMRGERVTVSERFRDAYPNARLDTGGWILRPLVELRTGYTDNVAWRADKRQASPELRLRGGIDATRETGIVEFNVSASHAQTLYTEGPNRAAYTTNASASLTLKPSAQVRLRASLAFDAVKEAGPANGIEIDGTWESYDSFAAFERIPIGLSLTLDGGLQRLDLNATTTHVSYDDLQTITGIMVSQDFRSGWYHTLRARATRSWHKALEAFIEGEMGLERYINTTADTDRISLVLGALLDIGPLMQVDFKAGYAEQDFRIADGASGLVYAGKVTWYASPLVTLTLDAAREFRGSVFTTSGGTFETEPTTTDRFTLVADWEPLRKLLVSLRSSWSVDQTDSANRRDTLLDMEIRAQYAVSDNVNAHLEISRQSGQSNLFGDVTRTYFSFGLSTPY